MTVKYSANTTTRRESLADTIAVRTPMAIPMISRFPNVTVDHVVSEWSCDEPFTAATGVRSITAPHTNTRLEGADWTYGALGSPVRARAVAEIQHMGIRISNTLRSAVIAGQSTPLDYHAGQLATRLLNSVDNVLLYGRGGPVTDGSSGVARRAQGLLWWAANSGLQRVHGTGISSLTDPYGVSWPASMWSVFVDFENANITGESFYNNLVTRITAAGGNMAEEPWMFQCGDRVMGRVAKFMLTDAGVMLNERNTQASEGVGYDHMFALQLPNGYRVNFRSNHWLNQGSSTYTVDNRSYTPGTPATPGTQNRTFQGDQTIIGHRPGCVEVCWYREPAFTTPSADGGAEGDRSQLQAVAEFTLRVRHPLDVAGAGNVLS